PSIHSRRDGGWRNAWPNPITNGATATMPTPSDRNQSRQTSENGAVVWSRVMVVAPPTPDAAAAKAPAARKPTTRRMSLNANWRPNDQQSHQRGLASIAEAHEYEVQRLLSFRMFAATVPTTTPIKSAG